MGEIIMKDKQPKVSVILPCFNREKYIEISLKSILNQTYSNLEIIVIDNNSTDNTSLIVKKYANADLRIKFIQNEENIGLVNSLNKALSFATGKYIARMDDDDISLPTRIEKQVRFLEQNSDIAMVGTFIEPIGNINANSWINITDYDEIEVAMNFFNPICHPTCLIKREFIEKNNIKYNSNYTYAEDYNFWKDIILHDGKIANIPEKLLQYRFHSTSATQLPETARIQEESAEKIRGELLNRFYNRKKTVNTIKQLIFKYPFEKNNKKYISNVIENMKNYSKLIPISGLKKFEKRYVGIPAQMEIFFACDNNFVQHLCVAITSILKNSLPNENFNFYILDGGITNSNKIKILSLKKIKNFEIEFIEIDDSMFKACPITQECQHISKQTYYRYIIPNLKPELEKAFYFDCDIVVSDSLNEFWNMDLNNNYVAAAEELWIDAHNYYISNGILKSFNAGILLINVKKWIEDDIPNKLFENTAYLKKINKLKWQDQDVLNYTFNNRVIFVAPKYNLQQTAFFNGQHSLYTVEEMYYSKIRPAIIHFSGHLKPWNNECWHPLWQKYYEYLKISPYHFEYLKYVIKKNIFPKFKEIIAQIFSIKNVGIHKVVTILCMKFKFKSKKLIERRRWQDLNNKLDAQVQLYNMKCSELANNIALQSQRNKEQIQILNSKIDEQTESLNRHLQFQSKIEKSILNQRLLKYEILKEKYKLIIREGTSDKSVFYQIFVDENYDYQYTNEPKIILDIGANVGYTSVYYAQKFPNAQIYCLEPDIDNFRVLQKNVSRYPNIKACNGALYDKDMYLYIYDPGLGEWGFQVSETPSNTSKKVSSYSFESLLKLWNIQNQNIDILKLDIEGSEKEVFEANTDFLNKVKVLFIETHDRFRAGTSQVLFNVMKDKDFILNVKGENLIFENKNL